MSANRYYLLDWHGRFMDHDPIQDRIVMQDLHATRYPGLWFTCKNPDDPPFFPHFHKATSRPMPLPQIRMVDAGEGTLALQETGRETYISATPYQELRPGTDRLSDWERFVALDTQMLHGLLILAHSALATITSPAGCPLPALTLGNELSARFGTLSIPVSVLRPALAKVAALQTAETLQITTTNETTPTITVARL